MSDLNQILPGAVWMAYHPWWSRATFHYSDGNKIGVRDMYTSRGRAHTVHIECKPHPALILAPGDENNMGYLVCYFSSCKSNPTDEINRKRLPDWKFNKSADTFMFCTAPCYCHRDFLIKSMNVVIPGVTLQFVKSFLKRACQLHSTQSWKPILLGSLEPYIEADKIETVRSAVMQLIDSYACNAAITDTHQPQDESDDESYDAVFNTSN